MARSRERSSPYKSPAILRAEVDVPTSGPWRSRCRRPTQRRSGEARQVVSWCASLGACSSVRLFWTCTRRGVPSSFSRPWGRPRTARSARACSRAPQACESGSRRGCPGVARSPLSRWSSQTGNRGGSRRWAGRPAGGDEDDDERVTTALTDEAGSAAAAPRTAARIEEPVSTSAALTDERTTAATRADCQNTQPILVHGALPAFRCWRGSHGPECGVAYCCSLLSCCTSTVKRRSSRVRCRAQLQRASVRAFHRARRGVISARWRTGKKNTHARGPARDGRIPQYLPLDFVDLPCSPPATYQSS